MSGFGACRQRGERLACVLLYRAREGRQRWHTIGRHGAPWTPDTTHDEARRRPVHGNAEIVYPGRVWSSGAIYELELFNGAASDADITALQSYAMGKWGS